MQCYKSKNKMVVNVNLRTLELDLGEEYLVYIQALTKMRCNEGKSFYYTNLMTRQSISKG